MLSHCYSIMQLFICGSYFVTVVNYIVIWSRYTGIGHFLSLSARSQWAANDRSLRVIRAMQPSCRSSDSLESLMRLNIINLRRIGLVKQLQTQLMRPADDLWGASLYERKCSNVSHLMKRLKPTTSVTFTGSREWIKTMKTVTYI